MTSCSGVPHLTNMCFALKRDNKSSSIPLHAPTQTFKIHKYIKGTYRNTPGRPICLTISENHKQESQQHWCQLQQSEGCGGPHLNWAINHKPGWELVRVTYLYNYFLKTGFPISAGQRFEGFCWRKYKTQSLSFGRSAILCRSLANHSNQHICQCHFGIKQLEKR